MMNRSVIIFILVICASRGSIAQEVSTKISNVYIDFLQDTPTIFNILSPAELAEKSRGLKGTNTEFMEIEGKVTDEQGIESMTLNGEQIEVDQDGYFLTNIVLRHGLNEIVFTITDGNQIITKKKFEIERNHKEIPTHDGGNYYALLIGIENYDDPSFEDLDYPVADVQKLYDVLVNQYSFNSERVSMVLDATREDIMNALDNLSDTITPIDNVLIFYAGHGVWDEKSEIGYWLPKNARKDQKAAWFGNSSLRDYIKEINSKHTLLIADACFSGSIFKSRTVLLDADMATNKLYKLPSRKAMTSGTLTAVPDRSVFMKFLLKRLEDNSEKYLSSEQLFTSMKMAVMNNTTATPLYGTVQMTGDEGGDFIFIKR